MIFVAPTQLAFIREVAKSCLRCQQTINASTCAGYDRQHIVLVVCAAPVGVRLESFRRVIFH
jgi:hypothetical protein